MWSADLWKEAIEGQGGGNPAYYKENIDNNTALRGGFAYDIERWGNIHPYDKVKYIKFGLNSPETTRKIDYIIKYAPDGSKIKSKPSEEFKKLFQKRFWWFVFMDNDPEMTKYINWNKGKMYQHIFSVLEYYYNLSLKMHNDSMQGIRGFLVKQFTLDFWFKKIN